MQVWCAAVIRKHFAAHKHALVQDGIGTFKKKKKYDLQSSFICFTWESKYVDPDMLQDHKA